MDQPIPNRLLLAIDSSSIADLATMYVVNYGTIVGFENIDIHIVNVQSPIKLKGEPQENKSISEITELAKTATAKTRRILDDAKCEFRLHIEVGNPADKIVQVAADEKINELILGSRGLGAIKNIALGSVAYKVIHLSNKPVTIINGESIVRQSLPRQTHKILLAVDGSECSTRAVEYISRLHYNAPIEVHLVNVQLPIMSGNVRRFIAQETIDLYYKEEGESSLRAAQDILHAAKIKFISHTLVGHIAETIIGFAEKLDCERIVMGTKGVGMIKNLVLGSIAYKVIHSADLPVTLIK